MGHEKVVRGGPTQHSNVNMPYPQSLNFSHCEKSTPSIRVWRRNRRYSAKGEPFYCRTFFPPCFQVVCPQKRRCSSTAFKLAFETICTVSAASRHRHPPFLQPLTCEYAETLECQDHKPGQRKPRATEKTATAAPPNAFHRSPPRLILR